MGTPFIANGRTGGASSIGETLARLGHGKRGAKPVGTRRTGQPVRRSSYFPRDPRALALWRPLGNNRDARRLIAARLQAAEFYDRRHKAKGMKNGPLGHVGLEVLRELYRIVDYKTGRLEPAIATICERVKRSKQAVVDALKRLRDHGFLDRVRRSEPTENEGAGPQVRQISNAYGFSLPRCAAAWVKGRLGGAPPPDCKIALRAEREAEVRAMIDALPLAEQPAVIGVNAAAAEILSRIGAALEAKSASLDNGKNPDPEIR
jgi:hypothetical protein